MTAPAESPGALVARRATERPDHPFVRLEEGAVTYRELDEAGNRVANAFLERGVAPQEAIAVMVPNGRAALEIWIGLAKAGIVEVPLHVSIRGDALAYQLNQARCRALIIAAELLERLEAVADRLETLTEVVVVGAVPPGPRAVRVVDYDELRAGAAAGDPGVGVAPGDRSVVLFTSGTTGPPKGVTLTHSANFALARGVGAIMEYGPGDVLFTAFPLSHVNARYTTVLDAMLVDAQVVLHERFSASRFWDICRREGVTAFNYLGGLPTMLLKQPQGPGDRDHRVARAYGAGAAAEVTDAFETRFGVPLVEVFGSTEMGMICHNALGARRPGTCGRANPLYEVEVHDAAGRPVAPGRPGEVVVRPRRPGLMFEGYFEDPAATVAAFRELWFHTGDRCVVDEDGYFAFVDRIKDAIRRRGENISAWEVEQALEAHPAVKESAVVGVPSALGEEEVLAIVVAADVEPAALLDHCQERLAHFAVPRYLRFVAALPRNASQRVEKAELRSAGLTGETWDREAHGYEVRR